MNDKDNKISRRGFLTSSLAVTGGLLLGSDAIASALNSDLVPEVVYFNGKIVTLDASGSTVSGVAVKDGKILKVGSSDEIKKLAGSSTRMVDLGGKTVVPGLIDAHCHPMETIYLLERSVGRLPLPTDQISEAGARKHSRVGKEDPKGRVDLCCLRFCD
jgi:hypothetical protein